MLRAHCLAFLRQCCSYRVVGRRLSTDMTKSVGVPVGGLHPEVMNNHGHSRFFESAIQVNLKTWKSSHALLEQRNSLRDCREMTNCCTPSNAVELCCDNALSWRRTMEPTYINVSCNYFLVPPAYLLFPVLTSPPRKHLNQQVRRRIQHY